MFFADLYKPIKNGLGSGYSNTTKFTFRSRPNNDLKFEFGGDRKSPNSIDTYFKWNQLFQKSGVYYNVGGKLDGKGSVDVNVSAGNVAKGLDLGLDATKDVDASNKNSKVKVSGTYRHEYVNVKAEVEKKYNVDAQVTLSAVTSYENISAGVEGVFKVPKTTGAVVSVPSKGVSSNTDTAAVVLVKKPQDSLQAVNFGFRYSAPNFHIVSVCENLETVRIGLSQTVDARLTVAGEFVNNVKPDKVTGIVADPVWSFGGNYVIDSDSSVSLKANTAGTVNVAYKVRLNSKVNTTWALETNVSDFSGGADATGSKVGITFDLDY